MLPCLRALAWLARTLSASDPVNDVERLRGEARAARAAGWRRSEIWWERLQALAKSRQSAGDFDTAARNWLLAWYLGWLFLARDDPRFACSLANAAAAAGHRGHVRAADRRRARARELWRSVPSWIDGIRPVPTARSSLFHLRLARRHAATYQENLRVGLRRHVEETAARLDSGALESPGEPCRWVRERPPVFDDTRRLLSACYLMAYAAPGPRRSPSAEPSPNPATARGSDVRECNPADEGQGSGSVLPRS